MDYKKFLSQKRQAQETPENIVDENGNCHFGTFKEEFKEMNFLDADHPTALPNAFNKSKLSLWEAAQIDFGKIVVMVVVCNLSVFGTTFITLYDTQKRKCVYWKDMLFPGSKAVVSDNLLDNSETYSNGRTVQIKYINNFQDGEASVVAHGKNKAAGTFDCDLSFKRISKPSIVSMPMGKNRPVYSQKDFLSVEGYIEYNGMRFEADETTTAIIDDHKGYYPRKTHYDWLTGMSKPDIDGKMQPFAFNLTRNQSVNQKDYNENLIWLKGKNEPLPPVIFKHVNDKQWIIKDRFGMVNITFDIGDVILTKANVGLIKIDYHIVYGVLSGYIYDSARNKYILDGICGIGEDKLVVL